MAIIELKKVVNMNPNYVRAYQLLALLYIRREHYAAARKVLMKAVKVDRNNMTTLRYLKEVNAHVERPQRLRSAESVRISDPNPIVIEDKGRQGYTDYNTGFISFINILIGIVIGTAVVWLLLVPSITKSKTLEYNQAVVDYSAQLSERNKEISNLEDQVKQLQDKVSIYEAQMGEAGSVNGLGGTALRQAVNYYLQGNRTEAGKAIAEIDPKALTDQNDKEIYETLLKAIPTTVVEDLYYEAESHYENGEYMAAVEGFIKVLRLDDSYSQAIYNMGRSYHQLGDAVNAAACYQWILDEFPDSQSYSDADAYLQQIIKAGVDTEAVQKQLEKLKNAELTTTSDEAETSSPEGEGEDTVTDDSGEGDWTSDDAVVDDGSWTGEGEGEWTGEGEW
jgi:tetratricopeptide (TPR) repeat protein